MLALLAASGAAMAQDIPQDPPSAAAPAPAAEAPAAPVAKKDTPKAKKAEVLPWADAPLVPASGETAETPEMAAASAQCGGQFEAACRDLKTCAWVADVTLQDGTLVPARCVARPPAPPKKSAKKAAPVAKKAEGASPETAAPAVKDSVTRVEDVAPEKPKVVKEIAKETEKKAEKKAVKPEPSADAAPKEAAVKAKPADEKAAEAVPAPAEKPKEVEKQAEKAAEAAKSPIVVKPPAKEAATAPAAGPSFGSFSTAMPGGDSTVTVTIPPPN
jgi:hypothetical protein